MINKYFLTFILIPSLFITGYSSEKYDTTVINNSISNSNNKKEYINSLKGKNEFGIVSGITKYAGSYPFGIYYAYHYSNNCFIQPIALWQTGESNENYYSYYHLGISTGFMADPKYFPFYFSLGIAVSHCLYVKSDYWGHSDTTSNYGFIAPTEWGLKTYLFSHKSLLTVGFNTVFGKINNEIGICYGLLVAITFLI